MSTKTKSISFRCSEKLRERLQRVAQEQEMTISEVITAACEDYTTPHPLVSIPVLGVISQKGIEWNSSKGAL